jgi:acyl-coenzyme A synthetase/AMP-(fatty) acid ligase
MAVVSLRDGSENGAVEKYPGARYKERAALHGSEEIFVLDELPKTGSGKIDRKGISNAYANR